MAPATSAPRPEPRWLSTAEAAEVVGTSDWWIRRRIESGAIKARTLTASRRRTYRIWGPDLAHFIDQHLDGVAPAASE